MISLSDFTLGIWTWENTALRQDWIKSKIFNWYWRRDWCGRKRGWVTLAWGFRLNLNPFRSFCSSFTQTLSHQGLRFHEACTLHSGYHNCWKLHACLIWMIWKLWGDGGDGGCGLGGAVEGETGAINHSQIWTITSLHQRRCCAAA